DESAIELVNLLSTISQRFDDWVDDDKPVSKNEKYQAITYALCYLPRNSFYINHFQIIQPLIELVVMDWKHATDIEESGIEELFPVSFVLRDSLISLIVRIAELIGGDAWGRSASKAIRKAAYDESLEDYVEGLK